MMHPVQAMEVRTVFELERQKPRQIAEHEFMLRLELARQRAERAARRRAWLARQITHLLPSRPAWRRLAERQAAQQHQVVAIRKLLRAPTPSDC